MGEVDLDRMRRQPSLGRVVTGFALSPITAGMPCAFALAMYAIAEGRGGIDAEGLRLTAGLALVVGLWAYPVAFVVAAPLYVLSRRWIGLTALNSAAAGAAVGASVAAAFLGAAAPELRELLLLQGAVGWLHLLALASACGALPGFVFYLIAGRPIMARGSDLR
ncbi:MAG: hypothetical protein JNK30_04125 [Phenylobacterium sp.]|uniref:hypothetical protein n=1 Tax=Phenylobacterium sp. TaxID=1871053 RepID=UPI001A4A27F0|nr:hypothetical protein [Phenylobacterium sp.]MBL8770546.1 hypothetical protein [Phenylobacterium sp.]